MGAYQWGLCALPNFTPHAPNFRTRPQNTPRNFANGDENNGKVTKTTKNPVYNEPFAFLVDHICVYKVFGRGGRFWDLL